jgi:N6-adenosine-specific RNA methylase IME4
MVEGDDQKYRLIIADPNWQYANYGMKKHGAAKAHYAGSGVEEICKIPVQKWADKDCILGLWCTWPKLHDGMRVMEAWGAAYVTGIPWVKTSPSSGNIRTGIGMWFQSTSELLLFGRFGKAKAPKREDPVLGLLCGSERQFYAPVREHSSKPMSIYDWAEERLSGPYLELFARNKLRGWTSWGHDLGTDLYEGGVRPYVKEVPDAIQDTEEKQSES